MKASDLVVGGKYNWQNQPERLVYMGRKLYPNGWWFQFAKVEEPDVCWSEVREYELSLFEQTVEPPKCACCGTTENLHRDYGSGGPYRCDSDDCVVY